MARKCLCVSLVGLQLGSNELALRCTQIVTTRRGEEISILARRADDDDEVVVFRSYRTSIPPGGRMHCCPIRCRYTFTLICFCR